MSKPSALDISFLGWGIWLPSNKNIAPVLFYYNWLSAEWCNSLPKSYFSSFECAHCVCFVWSALDDTRWINAIFLSFSSASILSVDPFKLSIPFLPLSSPVSFFSTSRRVLLYSFVILIDCINLLSIEFPVHHAEHNVEYYHNPSK